MEVYSTALWHLKREVQLAHLAQQAVALDRLHPATWCVMGNCFSLNKVRAPGPPSQVSLPPNSTAVTPPQQGHASIVTSANLSLGCACVMATIIGIRPSVSAANEHWNCMSFQR